jgi:5-methyltetrahydrofolate--homocysteine methyltransferase
MKTIIERITSGEVLLGDGAMGTLLMDKAKDLPKGSCTEALNLSQPEILEEIAKLYLNAGADIIQTNTFSASPLKLANYNLDEKTEEINRKAVIAVKKTIGDKAYVSASCGPSGKLLKPFGEIEHEAMYENFHRQLKVQIESGADIICVETMTDINESLLAVKAAKDISPDTPVMATMTFEPTAKGFFTIMGNNIKDVADQLKAAGADIIGSNCGNGIEKMILIAEEFKKVTDLPVIIQSNAGVPELKEGVPVYPESPEFMAKKCQKLIEAGVSIIGGCCGTTPKHISAMRKVIDSMN